MRNPTDTRGLETSRPRDRRESRRENGRGEWKERDAERAERDRELD